MCKAINKYVEEFLNKTRDPIEKLYGGQVLEKVPNYAKFWVEVIGYRENKPIGYEQMYGLENANDKEKEIDANWKDKYEQIGFVSYSIFFSLSETCYQLDRIKNITFNEDLDCNREDYNKREFEYWSAFSTFYIHIRRIYDLLERLFNLIKKFGKNQYKEFSQFCESIFKQSELNYIEKNKDLGSDFLHYRKLISIQPIRDRWAIPSDFTKYNQDSRKGLIFTRDDILKAYKVGECISPKAKMKIDLNKFFYFADRCYEKFKLFFLKSVKESGLTINKNI